MMVDRSCRAEDRERAKRCYLLTNAGTAGICQHSSASRGESIESMITLQRRANLLTARSDEEISLRLQTSSSRLLNKLLGASHVLVRAVRAAADQTGAEGLGPAILLNRILELGQRRRQIGGERAVDMGLQSGEVDADDLVVGSLGVGAEKVLRHGGGGDGGSGVCDGTAVRSVEIGDVCGGEGEERCGGADFCAHVADGSHASAAEGLDAFAEILDNIASSALLIISASL